ncbi:MAG: site-specific DNA-methyltransferase [Bacteroidetes bacterium]|nr:MAG: site-specific DNA-methyltransferase [Bacteroidota bacterium]
MKHRNKTIKIEETDTSLLKELITLSEKKDITFIENKVIHQDIFAAIPFLPENFADLMFIDPPYNLTKIYKDTTFKSMNPNEYEQWFESWFQPLLKVLKPTASVYVCCDWKSSISVFHVISKYLKIRNRITWEREKGRGATTNWKNCHEDIWFATVSDEYYFNPNTVKTLRKVIAPYRTRDKQPKDWFINSDGQAYRLTYPSNLWTDITIPFWSMPENTDHPTQKPEKLLAKIILASTRENDFVFDPFLGSGTTAVTAKKLNRKFCGIEINRTYCLYTLKRLVSAESDKRIQGYEQGVFLERNTSLILKEKLFTFNGV